MSDTTKTLERALPAYGVARRKEQISRAIAVLVPRVLLCGFWVRQMTPRTLAELELAGNAIVCGGEATAGECVDFLWRHSRHFVRPGGGWQDWGKLMERARISRYVAKRGAQAVAVDLRAFAMSAHQDSNNSSGSEGTGEKSRKQAAHWVVQCASLYYEIAGMTMGEYMDTPLNVLDQIYRVHLVRSGRDSEIYNESEDILTRHISAVMGRNK